MSDPIQRLSAALADRYVIEREIGEGGMATVYLAHDVRHDRQVALKVLRPELAAILGAERFLAEIRTTANLQHPHILPLHDSGEADGTVFYVMPFVEGESLRDRIHREKQLPVDDAVRLTREVADALDYAHRHGVVHRDIKPENILLHDGRALVADFGIALAVSTAGGGKRMTETGMSLGTPHYMAPEQAMGEREITPRADVYALGCVLYEMLTGEPPFTGPTAQAIIARVMTEEPRSVTLQRRTVPPHVEAAALTALAKLPADRFATAAQFADALARTDFTMAMQRAAAVPGGRRGTDRWRTLALATSATTIAAAAFAVYASARRTAAPSIVGRYVVKLDTAAPLGFGGSSDPPRLALSPDGRVLIYVAGRATTRGALREDDPRGHSLVIRPLASLAAREIAGTTGRDVSAPDISWDGTQVVFLADGQVRVASLQGGPPVTLPIAETGVPTWGPGGFVYFVTADTSISRVSSSGGPVERVANLPALRDGRRYVWVRVLPAGRGALVVEAGPDPRPQDTRLHVVDLRTGRVRETLQGLMGARFLPEAGALVYEAPDGTVMGVRFDERALTTRGRPVPLFDGSAVRGSMTDLTVSPAALAYTGPGINAPERMVWVRRDGDAVVPVDSAWHDPELESFALSPDGTRLAITIEALPVAAFGPSYGSRDDVWIKQLDHGPLSRLTFGGGGNRSPAWTPDGRFVTYTSERDQRQDLWRHRADGVGPEELVASIGRPVNEAEWSHDGKWLLLSVGTDSLDILAMRPGVDSVAAPLLAEPYNEWQPSLSPDGQWLAYVSDETGSPELFVRRFPDVQGGKWQLSRSGGRDPVWDRLGRLYFRSPDGSTVYQADLSGGPATAASREILHTPVGRAYEINLVDRMMAVSPDGQRFLFSESEHHDTSGDLIIVQNFVDELRAALAAATR